MLCSLYEQQLAKICVNRNEDTSFRCGPLEQYAVTVIRTTLLGLNDIMPLQPQPVGQLMTGAAINQKFNLPVTRTASRESCAMTAWA